MDAEDMMGELQQRSEARLRASGHTDCEYLRHARYDAASGMVVCGCGIFAELGNDAPTQPATQQSAAVASTGIAYVAADPIESTLALIDPTEVYAPEDVERHILDVLARLEMGEKFERQVIEKHYETKQTYDLKFAASILASEESGMDRRKADATVKCEDEFKAMNEAEFMRKAVQATMHNLRAVLTGYQSVSRSVGAAYNAGGAQHSHVRNR
jgi:hypothetical protein